MAPYLKNPVHGAARKEALEALVATIVSDRLHEVLGEKAAEAREEKSKFEVG